MTEVTMRDGSVRAVCDVCGKDRFTMSHEWDGTKWVDLCYLHWSKKTGCTLDRWLEGEE